MNSGRRFRRPLRGSPIPIHKGRSPICITTLLDALGACLIFATAFGAGCAKNREPDQEQAIRIDHDEASEQELEVAVAVAVAVPAEPVAEPSPGPALASPSPATDGRPPHPAIPEPLEELGPTQQMRDSTSFHWLSGHWIWTGNQYVWQPGVWIYDFPGLVLVPSRWLWDGEYWGFQDAGWAAEGSARVLYRPTALPGGSASTVPVPDSQQSEVELSVAPSSYSVYVWTGTWVAPPIVYPTAGSTGEDSIRYTRRYKQNMPSSTSTSELAAPVPDRLINVDSPPAVAKTHEAEREDEVELIPGVLHGGARGEEELRLMEEAKQREAQEQEDGVDSVYVPYYYDYYYGRYPARPRPPRPVRPDPSRPTPLPAPAPPSRRPRPPIR